MSTQGTTPDVQPRVAPRFQFSLATLMWLMLVVGILLAWWRDRREFDQRLSKIERALYPQSLGWGVDQATGAPNTAIYGDISTAWASTTPDGQAEWLLLTYDKAVAPTSVEIYETFNPGAVVKVSIFDGWGKEIVVWEGVDPTPPISSTAPKYSIGVSSIPVKTTQKTKKVKVYLDSPKVLGWNEIDAVGMKDAGGKTYWAKSAEASSSFGSAYAGPRFYVY